MICFKYWLYFIITYMQCNINCFINTYIVFLNSWPNPEGISISYVLLTLIINYASTEAIQIFSNVYFPFLKCEVINQVTIIYALYVTYHYFEKLNNWYKQMDGQNINTRLLTENSWLPERDSLSKPASVKPRVIMETGSCY